jgi:tRNA(adenine34) deaminase
MFRSTLAGKPPACGGELHIYNHPFEIKQVCCQPGMRYGTCFVFQGTMDMDRDEQFMKLALAEAGKALRAGEVPVGAVVVREGEVLASAHNGPVELKDPSAHAEILALRRAAAAEGNYRLSGTALYVTIEPCLMCAGALIQARVSRLVFGALDPKGGAVVSLYRVLDDNRLNHRIEVTGGVLAVECGEIMSRFFREKRL